MSGHSSSVGLGDGFVASQVSGYEPFVYYSHDLRLRRQVRRTASFPSFPPSEISPCGGFNRVTVVIRTASPNPS